MEMVNETVQEQTSETPEELVTTDSGVGGMFLSGVIAAVIAIITAVRA
jgi:hypothetical protein